MLLNTIFYTTAFAAAAVPALAAPAVQEGAALDAASSVVHPQQWPEVAYPQVLTASGEAHVRALLARMSVEQKVGQIIQTDIGSVTPQDVREYHLGSVLNGGNSGPGGNDLAPARAWLALPAALRSGERRGGTGGGQ